MRLLSLTDLAVGYDTPAGLLHAVDGVDLEIAENEVVGLVGESGCGKSTLAKAILRLLPDNGAIIGGEISYKDRGVHTMPRRELKRTIRWREISMIPQSAMNSFDPVYTVGDQIVEVIRFHEEDTSKHAARQRAADLFERVGLQPERLDNYPHQFSGGMAQRAMIALSLALDPALIIADEPTTALDVVIQDRILRMLNDLREEFGCSLLLITHDMSVVSEMCDRIAVMYGGRIVEVGAARTVIKEPNHPYTLGLKNSFPEIQRDAEELVSIPGKPPELVDPPDQCRFAPRCPFVEDRCWEVAPQTEVADNGHGVKCHRLGEAEMIRSRAGRAETWREETGD